MKCPYNNFQECLIEKCPSCNYKISKYTKLVGRKPYYMSDEQAIKDGYLWEETVKKYEFISCKLIDNLVQPAPKNETIINNKIENKSHILIKRSVF